jgi:hypothetical protein
MRPARDRPTRRAGRWSRHRDPARLGEAADAHPAEVDPVAVDVGELHRAEPPPTSRPVQGAHSGLWIRPPPRTTTRSLPERARPGGGCPPRLGELRAACQADTARSSPPAPQAPLLSGDLSVRRRFGEHRSRRSTGALREILHVVRRSAKTPTERVLFLNFIITAKSIGLMTRSR